MKLIKGLFVFFALLSLGVLLIFYLPGQDIRLGSTGFIIFALNILACGITAIVLSAKLWSRVFAIASSAFFTFETMYVGIPMLKNEWVENMLFGQFLLAMSAIGLSLAVFLCLKGKSIR